MPLDERHNKRWRSFGGFVLPGYHYLGPLNPIYKRGDKYYQPTNRTDYAARIHDISYARLLKKGKNPYTHFNTADSRFLQSIKHNTDLGSKIARSIFLYKKKKAKRLNELPLTNTSTLPQDFKQYHTTKRRTIGEKQLAAAQATFEGYEKRTAPRKIPRKKESFLEENLKNSFLKEPTPSNMTVDEEYSKMKFVKRQVKGKNTLHSGKWTPIQKHDAIEVTQISSAANNQGLWLERLRGLDMIQRHMFNPRYFSKFSEDQGAGSTFGLTRSFINAISGSIITKGIFQFGANTAPGWTNTLYDIHSLDPSAAVTNSGFPNNPQEEVNVFNCEIKVNHKCFVEMRNNSEYPAHVEVYSVVPARDFNVIDTTYGPASPSSSTSWNDRFFIDLGNSINTAYTTRHWEPDLYTTQADATAVADPYESPTFSFNRIASKSAFFQNWKISNQRVVRLKPGEHTKFTEYSKPLFLDVGNAVQRLHKLDKQPAVINLASVVVGIEESTAEFVRSVNAYLLKGVDTFLLYIVKGDIARGAAAPTTIGISPTTVDVVQHHYYSWAMRANEYRSVPTTYVGYNGTADSMLVEGDVEVAAP